MAWPLPYNDGTSPAAENIDQLTSVVNGVLVGELDADENNIRDAKILDGELASDLDAKNFSIVNLKGVHHVVDAKAYGASTLNSGSANKTAIQAAIDAMTTVGGVVLIREAYPVANGLVLKSNVRLQMTQVDAQKSPTPRSGSVTPGATPAGGAFLITDTTGTEFMLMRGNTSIVDALFYYPNQPMRTTTPATSLITYPPTIANDPSVYGQGMNVSNVTFAGATSCMDFARGTGSESYRIDNVRGYPLGGFFLKFRDVYDIPRVSNCHVNPNIGRNLTGDCSNQVIDYMTINGGAMFDVAGTQAFSFDRCFVFGQRTAFKAAGTTTSCYGIFSDCLIDQVEVGWDLTTAFSLDTFKMVGCSGSPCAGTAANRDFVRISGNAIGNIKLIGCQSQLSTNAVVASSISAQTTNSFVHLMPGSVNLVFLESCGNHEFGGFTLVNWIDDDSGSGFLSQSNSAIDGTITNPSVNEYFLRNAQPLSRSQITIEGNHPTVGLADDDDGTARLKLSDMNTGTKAQFSLRPAKGRLTLFSDSLANKNGAAAFDIDNGGMWIPNHIILQHAANGADLKNFRLFVNPGNGAMVVQPINDAESAGTAGFTLYRDGGLAAQYFIANIGYAVPASAAAAGLAGTISADANYIYVCVATNTWKRAALSTW